MNRFRLALTAVALAGLLLAACGSEPIQDRAAQVFKDEVAALDLDIDLDCTKDVFSSMADTDAQALADDPNTFDLTEGAIDIIDQAATCLSADSVIDTIIENNSFNIGFDADCARSALAQVDDIGEELASGASTAIDQVVEDCTNP